MSQQRPRRKGRATPPPTELPRVATITDHRRAQDLEAFAHAAVLVLEEQFSLTREQSKQWFEATIERMQADSGKPVRPLW